MPTPGGPVRPDHPAVGGMVGGIEQGLGPSPAGLALEAGQGAGESGLAAPAQRLEIGWLSDRAAAAHL